MKPRPPPHGELDVAYLDVGDDRLDYGGAHQGNGGDPYDGTWSLVLARSTNHGATWEETVIDGAIVPTQRFIVFLPPTPTLAIDQHTGRNYTAFTNGRLGDADINLWTSTDNGKTFRPPVRVNDTPLHDGTAQYLPKVAVAPTDDSTSPTTTGGPTRRTSGSGSPIAPSTPGSGKEANGTWPTSAAASGSSPVPTGPSPSGPTPAAATSSPASKTWPAPSSPSPTEPAPPAVGSGWPEPASPP